MGGSKFAVRLLCLRRSRASLGAGCSCSPTCSKFLHIINWPRLQLGSAEMRQRGNNKHGGGSGGSKRGDSPPDRATGAIAAGRAQEGTLGDLGVLFVPAQGFLHSVRLLGCAVSPPPASGPSSAPNPSGRPHPMEVGVGWLSPSQSDWCGMAVPIPRRLVWDGHLHPKVVGEG